VFDRSCLVDEELKWEEDIAEFNEMMFAEVAIGNHLTQCSLEVCSYSLILYVLLEIDH